MWVVSEVVPLRDTQAGGKAKLELINSGVAAV
jgi:hypothetical protein